MALNTRKLAEQIVGSLWGVFISRGLVTREQAMDAVDLTERRIRLELDEAALDTLRHELMESGDDTH